MAERPWLDRYPQGVPSTLDLRDIRLDELATKAAHRHPDRPALVFFDAVLTFAEVNGLIDRAAAALQELGLAPGDRVSVLMPNCPQLVIVYEAVWRCGGVVVPSNPMYTPAEFAHQAADAGSRFAFTLSVLYPTVAAARSETALEQVVVGNVKDYFAGPKKALFTLLRERKGGHRIDLPDDGSTHRWTDWMGVGGDVPQPVTVAPDDLAVLMYTGGTTGTPKAAMLSHANLVANATQVGSFVPALRDGEEVVLSALPLTHAYAITVSLNLAMDRGFTQVLVPDPRDLTGLLAVIDRHGPTVFPGVPTLYGAIARHRHVRSGKYDVSSISYCISGAAPLPPDVHLEFTAVTGAQLVEGYGLSEASPVTHCNPLDGGGLVGSIGVPLPMTDAKIVDEETETTVLEPGQRGVLCIAGPQVMAGYWRQDDETAATLRPDASGVSWLHTGDVAVMDEQGRFRIVDRKKDMILGSGGFNVYPREVEDVLYEHPAVALAGVIGVPPGEQNQRVEAYVVLRDGAAATPDELLEHCRERLARYKVPRRVEIRDDLPVSFVGKVLRRQLAAEHSPSTGEQ